VTVLLWGRADDGVVEAVTEACRSLRVDTLVADGEGIVSVGEGDLVTRGGQQRRLADISGVLVRPEAPLISRESTLAFQALDAWSEVTNARVLNRPSAAASNRSKPLQLRLIAESGFAVPDTIATTDPDEVRAFWALHGRVVYKSISGIRSVVAQLTSDHLERLDEVSSCPTQFQQLVAGTDHRVHVVGDDVYACRIHSAAVDYRYAAWSGHVTALAPVRLGDDAAERCVQLTRSLGLDFAGIDLRLDDDGTWWCFEVNTAPGFIWFEEQTGLPISAAVARALSG